MNFNENDLLREKTELLYLSISKLARAKVLLKLEFDTEDQVLFCLSCLSSLTLDPAQLRPGSFIWSVWTMYPLHILSTSTKPSTHFLSEWIRNERNPVKTRNSQLNIMSNCQAQFQLASHVTSWIEISFKFDYYHPHPPPPPPGKVEMQLDIDHIWSVGSWWIVCLAIFGGRG